MKRTFRAFELANSATGRKARLKGTIDVRDIGDSLGCELSLSGNPSGYVITIWTMLHGLIEEECTDATMEDFLGAIDILDELMKDEPERISGQVSALKHVRD